MNQVEEIIRRSYDYPVDGVYRYLSLPEYRESSEIEQVELICLFLVAFCLRYKDRERLAEVRDVFFSEMSNDQISMLDANFREKINQIDHWLKKGMESGKPLLPEEGLEIILDF